MTSSNYSVVRSVYPLGEITPDLLESLSGDSLEAEGSTPPKFCLDGGSPSGWKAKILPGGWTAEILPGGWGVSSPMPKGSELPFRPSSPVEEKRHVRTKKHETFSVNL